MGLATRTIEAAGGNRVPIPQVIKSSTIIHRAMDYFDHEDSTSPGIGGNLDAFPKCVFKIVSMGIIITAMSVNKLQKVLDCQKLVKCGRFTKRGQIPDGFETKRYQ